MPGEKTTRRGEPDVQDLKPPADAELRYHSLFEGVPVGLYVTTPEGLILEANPSLVEMLGYPDKGSLVGMMASQLYADPADRQAERILLARDGVVRDFETRLRRRDGTEIWVRDTCRAVYDDNKHTRAYEGSLQDITEHKEYERRLSHMARHDPLTGVFNRHALTEILDGEISRARRYGHPVGVLMIDVDRFKEVNDRFGHGTGDRVLCSVADALCRSIRGSDVVVRYGGDEFLVLLIETNGEVDIVRERIQAEVTRGGQMSFVSEFPVTLSIGTAHWDPEGGESIERVLNRADLAMYAEKRKASLE